MIVRPPYASCLCLADSSLLTLDVPRVGSRFVNLILPLLLDSQISSYGITAKCSVGNILFVENVLSRNRRAFEPNPGREEVATMSNNQINN